jgi:predicted phage-related endonuclease
LLSKNIKNLDQFLNKLENFDKNLTNEIENDLNTKQYIKAQYYKLNKKVYCNKQTLEKMKIKYDKVNSHAHLSAAFGL